MFGLLKKESQNSSSNHTFQELQKKYERKLTKMRLQQQGQIDSAPEMAYYQLTRGTFANYRSEKPIFEAIAYLSRERHYAPGETVYFKDLIELWSLNADYATGRMDLKKVKADLEGKSATVLVLKILAELNGIRLEYVSEGFQKIGFKFPY